MYAPLCIAKKILKNSDTFFFVVLFYFITLHVRNEYFDNGIIMQSSQAR